MRQSASTVRLPCWKSLAIPGILSVALLGCAEEREHENTSLAPLMTSLPVEADAEGVLHFSSIATFFQTAEALGKISPEERDAWEERLGFVSMRRAFDALAEELPKYSADEQRKLLAANSDLLAPYASELRRRIATTAYASFVDRRGIMYIDEVVHRITHTEVLTPRPGVAPAVALRLAGAEPPEVLAKLDGVDVFRYVGEEGALAACGSYREGTKTVGDRRVTYSLEIALIKVVDGIGNRQYRHAYNIDFWGYKKILGVWNRYNTTYQIYNTTGDVDSFKVTGFDGVRHEYVYERDEWGWDYFETPSETSHFDPSPAFLGDAVQNVDEAQLITPYFHKLHMEVTSRGTYPTRGIIECNYCGDGQCQSYVGETAQSCVSDCGYCGDGICFGNDTSTCPSDCPPPPSCAVPPCPCFELPCE